MRAWTSTFWGRGSVWLNGRIKPRPIFRLLILSLTLRWCRRVAEPVFGR